LLVASPLGAFMGYVLFHKLKSQSANYVVWWQSQAAPMLITGAIVGAVMISLYPWIQSHFHRG
jgi:hypothetical protein